MATTNTKERIVGASAELFRRQGYSGTGVKQILAEASAPFGSLYHHFPGGKEQLGAETIRRSGYLYGMLFAEIVVPAPAVGGGIGGFFAGAAQTLEEPDYADACPIATVALEVSSTSEPMREACAEVFEGWLRGATARFVQEGIARARARARRAWGHRRAPRARARDRLRRRPRGRVRPRPRAAQHRADGGRRRCG